MAQRSNLRLLTVIALALVFATVALAQSPDSTETLTVPFGRTPISTWQVAQQVGSSKGKLLIVTVDQPHRRQTCRVQSFAQDRLVCSRAIGGPRTYLPQQVLALLIPGDANLKLRLVLGLNVGIGTAIWGTVVLASICPACAAATGVAALLLFCAAGAILIGDDQPDHLLYLAPGQQLTGKLRFVQP
jgi:hypothetical protein